MFIKLNLIINKMSEEDNNYIDIEEDEEEENQVSLTKYN